jgi:hypothetical protein
LNDKEFVITFYESINKAYVVVDEAHYLKRIDGHWASAVPKLPNMLKIVVH